MPRSRKAQYRIHLKNELLETALTMFTEQGYDRTSLDNIAQRLDVTKGSVYWHFQNKQDLLKQVIEYWRENRVEDFAGIIEHIKTPFQRLEVMVEGLLATVNEQAVLVEFHQLGRTMSDIREQVEEVKKLRREFLTAQFKEAIQPESGMEAEAWADSFLLWYKGLIWEAAEKPLTRKRIGEYVQIARRFYLTPFRNFLRSTRPAAI